MGDEAQNGNRGGTTKRLDWQERFLEAYEQNGNSAITCKIVGVGRETVRRERQRDEGFAVRYADAKAVAVDIAEAELRRRALTGTPTTKTVRKIDSKGEIIEETVTESNYISTAALIAYLRANHPAYREQWKIEHVGDGGGPIKIEVERSRTSERLEELLRIAHELGWEPPLELPPGS